ncbi:hypothetical protein GCM10027084_26720 [Pseudoxanthomonas sangjuensis]|uniref:sialidase family protein n=1 Tax=Pseudoxanthomonas sangjuensis TaxID=1503750 RepID=UPI0013911880|nr:sialidase family protein [Pseudoxanthomonas sangjuensis]
MPIVANPSAQPDLIEASDGGLLLSWMESEGGSHVLKLSKFDGKVWDTPREVARGDDWVANWADTPHVAASGATWWAHWLRKSEATGHAYDVVLSRSDDRGATWSAPTLVNTDGVHGEHGFVSMWPEANGALGIAWLDGRKAGGGHGGHEGHGGAMTLRTALFDATGERISERELDARTCDCCQTAMARTSRGPLLAWRDRDENEIRDIVVARRDGEAWTSPHKVHDDQWRMPACPVNGPSVAARGNDAWVAWYTAADDRPRALLAHSPDAGDGFGAPVEIEGGDAVQGRAAVVADDEAVWVAWLREDASAQSLWLAAYTPDLRRSIGRVRVADLQGRGRATGFPQMALRGDVVHLVWTDISEGKPRLRGSVVVTH